MPLGTIKCSLLSASDFRFEGLKIRRYLVPWGFDSPSRHQLLDSTLLTSNNRRILPQSYRLNDACCAEHRRAPHGKEASHDLAVRQNRREMEVPQADLRSQQKN